MWDWTWLQEELFPQESPNVKIFLNLQKNRKSLILYLLGCASVHFYSMTYIKVYKYSARRWQPGILNVRIRKYFSDSCFGSPEFFGICSTSLSLTPRHDPNEALSHSIPKSKQADENNEWIASNRILAFTRRFLGSPRGITLQLTKKDCMVTDVPSSQVEKKQTINSWIHNSFYFWLVCDVARHCFLVLLRYASLCEKYDF